MKESINPIPLFTPDFTHLKADAVWVTIANWAEGLQDYYGLAEVVAGNNIYTPEKIRAKCFSATALKRSIKNPGLFRKSYLAKLGETFIKDMRWLLEEKSGKPIDVEKYRHAPFIWQHHDLFQTRGLRLAKHLGVPSVLFVDAPYVWESKKWGIRRLGWEWFAKRRGDSVPCRQADLVLAVSDEVKKAVIALGVDEKRVLVTPCTVATEKFDNFSRVEFRRSLGVEDDVVVGWIGSFRKFHSLDLLVDAFAEALKTSAKLKLLLVGDGPERIRLKEKVANYGMDDKVIFPGNIPHTDIHNYISTFDLAVLPSEAKEGFHYSPLKLREFFAAGVPVIASAVGDVKKVIEESGGGWLVPPGSKDAIAAKLITAAVDETARIEIGKKAKQYAMTEMGIAKQIKMIENFFSSISPPTAARQ